MEEKLKMHVSIMWVSVSFLQFLNHHASGTCLLTLLVSCWAILLGKDISCDSFILFLGYCTKKVLTSVNGNSHIMCIIIAAITTNDKNKIKFKALR